MFQTVFEFERQTMTFSFQRATRVAAFAMAALFLAAPAVAQVQLKWTLKKGEKLNYEVVQNLEATNRNGKIKVNQTIDLSWNVKETKSDGSAVIGQKITRIRVAAMDSGMTGKVEYDTRTGPGEDALTRRIHDSMGALITGSSTLTLTPRGEIKDLKLSRELKAAFAKAKGVAGATGGGIDADTLKQIVGLMGAVFPAKAVTKGDTWKHALKSNKGIGELHVKLTRKYTGMQTLSGNKVARIESDSQFTLTPRAGFPGKISIKDKGSKTTSYFSVAKGRLISMSGVQNMDLTMTIGTRNIPMSMKIVQGVKLK